ncbi:MAG: sensor histidine kinase [Polyangiaceae bacterium]|nr:sensor histidine kinase [Polyangiaceae bacterium]
MSVQPPLSPDVLASPPALSALQVLSTPVWVFDLSRRRVTWANQAAVEFWKADSEAQLLERDFGREFSLASEGRMSGYAHRLKAEPRITEQWTLYPGASPVTVLCSFTLLPSLSEGPTFLVEATSAFPDSASGDTLRAVEAFRHTTALVSVIDPSGHTLMENPAAIRTYGHLLAGSGKHAFMDRFADSDDAARALHRVSNGKEFVEEVWVNTLDGQRRHAIEARQTNDPVTGARAILLSEIDVTFRHEAEEVVRRVYSELESRVKERTLELERLNRELGEERQFVSAVVETVGSLLIVTDAYGTAVRVNRALCELTGYKAEELTGRPIWETLLASPEAELVERAFAEHGPRFHAVMPKNVEGLLRTKSGEPRMVSLTNAALLDGSGLTEYVIGAGVDVTDRKEIQLRLQISDRMASIGTLAAGVAHGINNPLAYVIANLDYVRNKLASAWSELPPEDVREVRELLSESLEGADRVRRIVGDLRMFSRQSDDRVQAVDLVAVIERALNMAMNEIRHRARVVLKLDPLPRVLGTESKLGQVVLNLLVNAAQAIEAGNVEKNSITVRTLLDKHGRPRLEIQDTGVGIPEEYLRRVFDPFFTTKPVGIGTGLGLSISHRIVSEFGGEIGIESEHLRGTMVWMSLETAPLEVVVPKQTTYPPPSTREHAARVLIVDDEPAILRALSRVLSGYQVTRALSGKEAIAHIEASGPFDVVFCDVMMPELSGIDVFERAKQVCPGQEQRIVFITGGAFTEHAARFIESIDNPKLGKPFDAGEVRALVKALTRDPARDTP